MVMAHRIKHFAGEFGAQVGNPWFWSWLAVATVGYFTAARLLQDWLYRGFQRPADLFESFGPKFVDPEPLEIPLYLLGYAVIPLLALALQRQTERWWPVIRAKPAARWVLIGGSVVAAAVILALLPWERLLDFSGQAVAYLQTRGIRRAMWLLLTKRLFVTSMLVITALAVFFVAYVVGPRWRLPLTPAPALERWLARRWWLMVVALALLVWHPNLPVDYHHASYFIAPVNDQLHGKPLLYETNNLYGILNHYLLLGVFGLHLLPFTYPAFSFVVAIVFFGFLTGLFFTLRAWLKSPTYAALATLATYATLYLFQTSPTRSAYHFPANTPFRFWLVIPVLALFVLATRSNRRWIKPAAIGIASLSIWWNLETGLAIAAATILTLLVLEPGRYFRTAKSLAGQLLAWNSGIFAAITVGNWLAYGRPPQWRSYLQEIAEFGRGIAMYPLPAIGVYTLLVTCALAVLLWQLLRQPRQPSNGPLLFLTLYGTLAMVHYVGESTWQTLFMATWPFIIILCALADTVPANHAFPGQRVAGALLASSLVFFLGWYVVKLPVEWQSRNYGAVKHSFWTIPPAEAVLVRDAEILKRDFPDVRLPLIHINDSKLLYYAGKTNWLPVYYSFTLYYRSQLAALAELIADEQPTYVLIGNGTDALDDFQRKRGNELNEFFRPLLPAGYVLDRQLETLDIYRWERDRKN